MNNPRTFQTAAAAYIGWVLACITVFGLGQTRLLLALLAAGVTVFALFTGTVVAVCRRRDHLRRPAPATTPAVPDTEQFLALMRELGAGDLEHLGLD